jgi:hypothetical protein
MYIHITDLEYELKNVVSMSYSYFYHLPPSIYPNTYKKDRYINEYCCSTQIALSLH